MYDLEMHFQSITHSHKMKNYSGLFLEIMLVLVGVFFNLNLGTFYLY